MESYLKECEEVDVGEETDNKKILNLIIVKRLLSDYSEFDKVTHLPDDRISIEPLENVLETFLCDRNDRLGYFLSPEIDYINKTINIFILPVVEAA